MPNCKIIISVGDDSAASLALAKQLAVSIGLEFIENIESSQRENKHAINVKYDYCLLITESGHKLIAHPSKNLTPLIIDFNQASFMRRLQQASWRNELVARACNAKQKPKVLDLTAGLGRDAVMLAWLGCDVLMLERSPIMHFLLSAAIESWQQNNSKAEKLTISLRHVNAIVELESIVAEWQPEVIYIDPMHPPRQKKSALVKKDMRILRDIVGEDQDSKQLLINALKIAQMFESVKRVVIKLPINTCLLSESLTELELGSEAENVINQLHVKNYNPDLSYSSKTSRFDVYLFGAGLESVDAGS